MLSHAGSKSTSNLAKAGDKSLITRGVPPLPQVAPLPVIPPLKRLPAAKTESKLSASTSAEKQGLTNQKSSVTNQKAVIVEVEPVRTNEKKPSRLGAFFKKTGRFLKKPFK